MGHVIVFGIHERVTAMPATKEERGKVLRCWRGKASVVQSKPLLVRRYPKHKDNTHHPDARAERVWGQVRPELPFYDTRVAVRTSDTTTRELLSMQRSERYRNVAYPQITRTFEPWTSRFAR